jgi:DNA repair photolyase
MPRRLDNPPNPWQSRSVEWLEEPPEAGFEVYEERARSILTANDSPDLDFTWSLNPYRGCFHGCAYCYARPSHQYLDFGAGTDFERRIVVKVNAAELLREELARGRTKGEVVVFSGNTDCYQPLEASYGLTRACLEVCLEFRQAVAIVTKGALVMRDAELLAELERRAGAHVAISLAFLDSSTARLVEPHTSSPERRLEALRRLAELGIPTGLALAPVIPGLNDAHIPELLARAARAGASGAWLVLLRLPAEVEDVFRERLAETAPGRVEKILSALRDARGGPLTESTFGRRMVGRGPRWQLIEDLFRLHCRRNGLNEEPQTVSRAPREHQGELFRG